MLPVVTLPAKFMCGVRGKTISCTGYCASCSSSYL